MQCVILKSSRPRLTKTAANINRQIIKKPPFRRGLGGLYTPLSEVDVILSQGKGFFAGGGFVSN